MDHREQNRLANMLFERLKPSIISFADHRAAGVSASMNTGLDGLGYACFEVIAELAKELASASPINWQPIANLPEDRKDGRPLLLWSEFNAPRIGAWDPSDYFGEPFGWADSEEAGARITPDYWADINPPT